MVDGAVMNCAYKRTHFRPGDKTKETTKNPKRKKKGIFRFGKQIYNRPSAADRAFLSPPVQLCTSVSNEEKKWADPVGKCERSRTAICPACARHYILSRRGGTTRGEKHLNFFTNHIKIDN